MMAARRLVRWLPAVAWAAWMFGLSGESFGSEHTRSWLGLISAALGLDISSSALDLCNGVLRKSAHVAEYAVLAWLLYRAIRGANRAAFRPAIALLCVFGAAVYAATDEFHQLFVPGRHAALLDCGIDTAGAALAMLAVRFVAGIRSGRFSEHGPA